MLTEEEAYKISQLANLFEEVDAEIIRIRETLHGLSEEAELTPSPSVRENFIETLKRLKQEDSNDKVLPFASLPTNVVSQKEEHQEPSPATSTTTHQSTTNAGNARVVAMPQTRSSKNFLMAASVIALVICLAFLASLYNKNNKYEQQLASVEKTTNLLQQSNKKQQEQLQSYAQMMAVIHNPDYKKVQLPSLPGKPKAVVEVFWNKKASEVFVCNVTLPNAPQGKQYQLWAIVKGKPVDAGMLTSFWQPIQKMNPFNDVDAFAVTLEKEGGSPTPTMEAMYVMAPVS
jgi:anti-sigma-K factor RskA